MAKAEEEEEKVNLRDPAEKAKYQDAIIDAIASAGDDGIGKSGIRAKAGGTANQVTTIVKELEAEGKVKRQGKAKGTTYRMV